MTGCVPSPESAVGGLRVTRVDGHLIRAHELLYLTDVKQQTDRGQCGLGAGPLAVGLAPAELWRVWGPGSVG